MSVEYSWSSTEAARGLSSDNNEQKPAKVCGVCGDRAKSYHFGGISCDSCKAFFRRSVQNEAYKNFQCPYEGRCEITITSRKCCQFCRFRKCNDIGMEKGWVMTEEERTQLLKSRLERKQRLLVAKSTPGFRTLETPTTTVSSITSTIATPAPKEQCATSSTTTSTSEPSTTTTIESTSPLNTFSDLSPEDVALIEELVNTYQHCSHPLEAFQSRRMVTRSYVLHLFFSAIKQFSYFSQKLSSFRAIPIMADKETLLRSSVLEMLFLRSAYAYDDRLKGWVLSHDQPRDVDEALVYLEDVREFVDDDLLIEKHKRFVKTMRQAVPERDNIIYTILMAISLHCGDRKGLLDTGHIALVQERYLMLLKTYLHFRYPDASKALYARILLKLPDLREVAECHQEFDMKLSDEETKEIRDRLAQQDLLETTFLPRWKFHENVFASRSHDNQ
ncbi:vitamin D3 receptor [Galendromus occidentalis]|uniref:Vitamin D3 receptor n=1 Tax=Galendromus occidentalis TaxID=34638 RepID=A0AAJ6QYS3_9ACAR|nr:vitamin D3 receptor [Galendromus occidentalis]